jgi:hypothetical protein
VKPGVLDEVKALLILSKPLDKFVPIAGMNHKPDICVSGAQ